MAHVVSRAVSVQVDRERQCPANSFVKAEYYGPRVGPEVPPTLSQKGLEGQNFKILNIHGTTSILIAPGPFSIYQHEVIRITHCKQQ